MTIVEAVERLNVDGLAKSMRDTGFGCVENALASDELSQLQAYARDAVRGNGNQYAYLAANALAGSAIGELGRSPQMMAVLAGLYEATVGAPPAEDEVVHPALRCLFGSTGEAESLRFHFDSWMVTALLPIAIPKTGNRGDFLYYPNVRRVRRSALVNVAEKALTQNPVSRRLLASDLQRSLHRPKRLELVPRNMYLFWGYRTFHGNDRCDPDQLRATALFHFGDPHRSSPLVRLIQKRVDNRTQRSVPPTSSVPTRT
jgi:hypothetical protein